MSRLEETETEIADLDDSYSARTYTDGYADLARTLAAEVDAMRGKLDDVRMGIGCARGQRSTQFCADLTGVRAELARVKAESLRVVVDGDMREAYRCNKVLHDGRYCVVGRRILDDYFPIQISDAITGKYVDKVTHQTLLQPVRLERWEDE